MSFASVMASKSPSAWWRLGESSGTTMTDSSGNGRNGVYSGSPWTPPTLGVTGLLHDGDTNTAASFNGTTSEAEVTYNSAWMNNDAFSVFARIKPNTVTGNHSVVGRWVSTGGSVNAWVVRQDGSTLYLWWNIGGTYYNLNLGTVASGTEYSVGVSVGGGSIWVYLNGSLAASTTNAIRSTTANLIIGANWQGSPNELFSGVIDEVAYWNATISATDHADLHNAAVPAAVSASGTASLSLSASGGAGATASGSASLNLSASGSTSAPAGGSASLTLSASGSLVPPVGASGSAALALSASGGASGAAAGAASLNLIATGTALAVLAASGSATLTLSASGSAVMSAGGTATLTLSAGGVAIAVFETDLSNALDGLDLLLTATVVYAVPVAAAPAGLAERYDVAIPYPPPVMVNGRPT